MKDFYLKKSNVLFLAPENRDFDIEKRVWKELFCEVLKKSDIFDHSTLQASLDLMIILKSSLNR